MGDDDVHCESALLLPERASSAQVQLDSSADGPPLLAPRLSETSQPVVTAVMSAKPLSLLNLEKFIAEQLTRLRFEFPEEHTQYTRKRHAEKTRYEEMDRTKGGYEDERIDWSSEAAEGRRTLPYPRILSSRASSRQKPPKAERSHKAGSALPAKTPPTLGEVNLTPPFQVPGILAPIPVQMTTMTTAASGDGNVAGLVLQAYLKARLALYREAGRRFCETFSTYRGPLEDILAEFDAYASHVGSAAQAVQTQLQEQAKHLLAENEALRSSIEGEQVKRKHSESTVDDFVRRIESLEIELRDMRIEKEVVEHDLRMSNTRNAEADHEKAVLTRKVMALEGEIAVLEGELRDPRKETERLMGQLEAKATYITTLTHQQEKTNSELVHLRRQLLIQLEKEAARGRRPASPASRLRAVGEAKVVILSDHRAGGEGKGGTLQSGSLEVDLDREREAHGRSRAKLAQSQEYCAMLLSQLDRWKNLFRILLDEHRSSSGVSTKPLDEQDLEGGVEGADDDLFPYSFPSQSPPGLIVPAAFQMYKGKSLLAAVRHLVLAQSCQGGMAEPFGGSAVVVRGGGESQSGTSSPPPAPKSILRASTPVASEPPPTTAPNRRSTIAAATTTSPASPTNSIQGEISNNGRSPKSHTVAVTKTISALSVSSSQVSPMRRDLLPSASSDQDIEDMEFTPRPKGNFINLKELNDAPGTAMKLAQAAQLIIELKLEASRLRAEKDALVNLRSNEVNAAVTKLNDIFSSEGFGGGGGAYDNREFRTIVALADSNPTSRWFVGVGDHTPPASPFLYLRAVGRQRNQRFSLGTVKWHIHSFLQMSTSSAAASVVASIERVLSADASTAILQQQPSVAVGSSAVGRRRSSLIPVVAPSPSTIAMPPPPATTSPSIDLTTSRTFAVGGALSGVLGAVGGGLGGALVRCGERLAVRFASWMEDRYGKDGISMCYSFHNTMAWFAPVDVDCFTFKSMLANTFSEGILKKQYLATARLRNEMEKLGAQYIRSKLRLDAAAGGGKGGQPGGGHPCFLPDGSMVTPHEIPIEVARQAILNVFAMWSRDRQLELESAMDVLDGGESIGAQSTARRKKLQGGKAKASADQWGSRIVNLRKLFDNKTLGHGQMEAHFVTVLRTLWVVETFAFANEIVEALLEDVTAVSGMCTPQTLVNSILLVDPNVPDHVLHDAVETVFAPPSDRVEPIHLSEATRAIPITDRYLFLSDKRVALPMCIARLRMLLLPRHSSRRAPIPAEASS